MKERYGIIECGKCGFTTRLKYNINLTTIKSIEEKLVDESCQSCGCNDPEELEKYVVDLDKEKKNRANSFFRSAH